LDPGDPTYPEETDGVDYNTGSAGEVSTEAKAWIEESFLWFIEQFGPDTVRSARPVVPTAEFFPGKNDGSIETVRQLVRRVCGHMNVDPNRIEVNLHGALKPTYDLVPIHQTSYEGPAGLFMAQEGSNRLVLAFEASLLAEPKLLVATIAHELAHVHLLADKRLVGDEDDHEQLTDLLTVFLGMGVFTANAAFQFAQGQCGTGCGWSTSRMGYLSEPMYGYALAGFSWVREESDPRWPKYLSVNLKHYYKRSLTYLRKTGRTCLPRIGHV
jgi:hypothetical protein